jgi:hypothetical protein
MRDRRDIIGGLSRGKWMLVHANFGADPRNIR